MDISTTKNFKAFLTGGMFVFVAVLALNFGDSSAEESDLEGDAEAGKTKATTCAACHGQEGISSNTLWPNLAGQQEGYLKKSITDFRDGIRTEVTMQPFVKDLTDQDIADLSAYFTGLSPCP